MFYFVYKFQQNIFKGNGLSSDTCIIKQSFNLKTSLSRVFLMAKSQPRRFKTFYSHIVQTQTLDTAMCSKSYACSGFQGHNIFIYPYSG